jgi:hypothetical protein
MASATSPVRRANIPCASGSIRNASHRSA